MKALIALFIPIFCHASIMGPVDVFKPVPPSDLLLTLEAYRACEGELRGHSEVEKLLDSIVRFNTSESVYLTQVQARMIGILQIHREALDYINVYLGYANVVFSLKPDEIKLELQRTRAFREATTRLTADLPPKVHLSEPVKLLNAMLLLIWKDPRLLGHQIFLDEIAREVSRWNSRDVRMALEYEAQARLASAGLISKLQKWRAQNNLGVDPQALSDLSKAWEKLIVR